MKSQENTKSTLGRIYSRLSIRKKLMVLIASVAGFVTVTSILLSFFVELSLFKSRLLEEYELTASMAAFNLDVSIAFDDKRDASEILSVLAVQKYIESAAVYLPDQTVFTTYVNEDLETPPKLPPFEANTGIESGAIFAKQPIVYNDKTVAYLIIRASQGELNAFKLGRSWVFVTLVIFSLGTAIFLAIRLGNHVSRPIIELAQTTRRITEDHDVSTRQKRVSDDETGQLVDAFNEMMEEIEKRSTDLVLAKEKAEASSRAKDDFLSVISHELRTPLNPIIGYVEILLRSSNTDESSRQLGLIKQYAEHLQSLIDRVIDFSRFERGRIAITTEPVDYQRLCRNALSLLKGQADEKNIELHYLSKSQDGFPQTLLIDRVKIQQVVLNLVSNALKFTEQGSIALSTSLQRSTEDEYTLRIEVKDTGIGIEDSDRDLVFKPFSQIDVSLTRQYSGMGLGLAITQRIVEALNGQIGFFSKKGVGSTFWLEIPVVFTEETDPDPSIAPVVDTSPHHAKQKVLLVDDQLVNLELGESMLTSSGHDVACARSGQDAVELATKEIFNLIILDIKMPKMNGYETARALRKLENVGNETPIIAMTAHVTTRGNEECIEAGMNDSLSKPFNTERLNLILRKWLSQN